MAMDLMSPDALIEIVSQPKDYNSHTSVAHQALDLKRKCERFRP